MKRLKNISLAIIYALAKFTILLCGLYLIFIYAESGATESSDIGVPTGAIGAFLELVFFSSIWLIIWYSFISHLLIKSKRKKYSISIKANKIALLLPLIGVSCFIIWLYIIHPMYYKYKHNRLIEKQNVLTNSILNKDQKEVLKLIDNNTYENYGVLDLDSIYFPVLFLAAQNDIVIYEALLDKFEKPNSLSSGDISKRNEICVFCYIDNEDLALKTLDKISMGFWDYSTSLYCDNKDILIFFIEKKWIRCIDAYLTKYKETIHRLHRSYEPYNCQTRYKDSSSQYFQYKTVNPYDYTTDRTIISTLEKHIYNKSDQISKQ